MRQQSPRSDHPSIRGRALASIVLVATVVIPSPSVWADDWYVDVNNAGCPSGTGSQASPFCQVMDAVNSASAGDTIHLAPGTYFENVAIGFDLHLVGTGGAAVTIIDASFNGSAVTIDAGITVNLEGLTITHGDAERGGGIFMASEAMVTLTNSTVQGNTALAPNGSGRGGGIYTSAYGSLTLIDSTVASNRAREQINVDPLEAGLGGGIYAVNTAITVMNSTLSFNRAEGAELLYYYDRGIGGGIYAQGGCLMTVDSLFTGNTADPGSGAYTTFGGIGGAIFAENIAGELDGTVFSSNLALGGSGGGIHVEGIHSVSIHDCQFTGNRSQNGGAIYQQDGAMTLTNTTLNSNRVSNGEYTPNPRGGGVYCAGTMDMIGCQVTDNFFSSNAGTWGGGIYNAVNGTLTATHTIIAGNEASYDGGGVVNLGTLSLINSLVIDNEAGSDSGGIENRFGGRVTLTNTTVSGNSAFLGGGIKVDNLQGGGFVRLDHSIVAQNTATFDGPDVDGTIQSLGHILIGDTTDTVVTGDLTGSHLDVDPLFHDPANGDYSLQSGSPCVDGGALGRVSGTDFEGNPRFLDGDLDGSAIVDLGALEYSNVQLTITGDATPGGTLTFESTGTTGLSLFLFVGVSELESISRRYGNLFIDLTQPWGLLPFGAAPSSQDLAVGLDFPIPSSIVFQLLATNGSGAGNFSNALTREFE